MPDIPSEAKHCTRDGKKHYFFGRGVHQVPAGPFALEKEAPRPASFPILVLNSEMSWFSDVAGAQIDAHAERLRSLAREKRNAVMLKSTAIDSGMQEEKTDVLAELGKMKPGDEFQGDANLRTLRFLLKLVDNRGFERCARKLKSFFFALRVQLAVLCVCVCPTLEHTGLRTR